MNTANTDTGMRVEQPLLPQSASRESSTALFFHVFCGTIVVALVLTAGEILLNNAFSEITDLPRFQAVLVYGCSLSGIYLGSALAAWLGNTGEQLATIRALLLFAYSSVAIYTGTYTLGWNTHASIAGVFSSMLICIIHSAKLANLSLVWFFIVGLTGFALSPGRAPLLSQQAYPLAATWSIFTALILPFVVAGTVNVIMSRIFAAYECSQREMQTAAAELKRLADTDQLTGFFNRNRLEREFRHSMSELGPDETLLVALLDLDNFKAVNTSAGHAAGDAVLKHVAADIRSQLPTASLVRLGGDEFIAMQRVPLATPSATAALDNLAKTVSMTYLNETIRYSMSIGFTEVSKEAIDLSQATAEADLAMRQAKREGKARATRYAPGDSVPTALASPVVTGVFNPTLTGSEIKQEVPPRSVGAAILSDEIDFEYQPIIDARTNTVVAVEALVRWRLPDESLVPMQHYLTTFVSLEWQSPFIEFLSKKRLKLIEEIRAHSPIDVHFNFAVESIESYRHSADVSGLVDEAEGRNQGLVIELSEKRFQNVAMAPTSTHQSFPHRERAAEMGVKLALDDFGKGESNLDRLVSYPVQIVKLDRSLCLRVADSRKARTVIKSTQQICEDLGITLIAEGIETQTHHETLLELGVGIHQGFYHHRPMAKDRLFELLDQQAA